MGTHYDTLGVAKTASSAEIRKAYLRRARALHPDRQLDSPEAQQTQTAQAMRQVNSAWDVLSNADKKATYDRQLKSSNPTRQPRAATDRTPPRTNPRPAAVPPPRPSSQPKSRSIDEEPGDGSVSIWASIPVMLLVGLLLGVVVITAFSGGEPAQNQPVVSVVPTQFGEDDCFELVGASDPRLRSCTSSSATGKVISIQPSAGNCPTYAESVQNPGRDNVICWAPIIPGSAGVTAAPG